MSKKKLRVMSGVNQNRLLLQPVNQMGHYWPERKSELQWQGAKKETKRRTFHFNSQSRLDKNGKGKKIKRNTSSLKILKQQQPSEKNECS